MIRQLLARLFGLYTVDHLSSTAAFWRRQVHAARTPGVVYVNIPALRDCRSPYVETPNPYLN